MKFYVSNAFYYIYIFCKFNSIAFILKFDMLIYSHIFCYPSSNIYQHSKRMALLAWNLSQCFKFGKVVKII